MPSSATLSAAQSDWQVSTMISDEKRHEVASHLRKLSETDSFIGELKPSDELYDCMCLMAIRATVGKGDIFERLADLIDRPTCRNIYDESKCGACANGFECSECGNVVEDGDGWLVNGTFNYCSECGAEVVE